MLREGRERRGFTIGQVPWRLGITRKEYVELEAGLLDVTPDLWQRCAICAAGRRHLPAVSGRVNHCEPRGTFRVWGAGSDPAFGLR